jgi:shikimate dehydrogenase
LNQDVLLLDSFCNPYDENTDPVLIINATSLGLRPEDPSPVDLTTVDGNLYVYDMVYNPPVTQLMTEAKKKGYPVANGLGMLVGQAARSLGIWAGREVSVQAMSEAAQAAISA